MLPEITRHPTAPTGVGFVTHSAAGHKFDYLRKNSAASLMTPETLAADYIAGAKFFHLSAIGQAISESARLTCAAAITAARKAGVKVSYDTNLRLRLWELDRGASGDRRHDRAVRHRPAEPRRSQQLTGPTAPEAIVDYYLGLALRSLP